MKVIYHPSFSKYQIGEEYLDRSSRIEETTENIPAIKQGLERLISSGSSELVEWAKNGEKYLDLVHGRTYIERIKNLSKGIGITQIGDNFFSEETYQTACFAVGASVQSARRARRGKKSIALVRPPGHHAYANQEGGFCVFNNIAIASEYLRQKGERVMIIDIDLHLGDGTLNYAQGRDDIFYFSINQLNLWPNINPEDYENTKNIFLPEGTNDNQYIEVLEGDLNETLKVFNPKIVAVSAGFDTHKLDHKHFGETFGGGFDLTQRSYKFLWKILDKQMIPYFLVLEGGYHPESLIDGVLSFLEKNKIP